MKRLLLLVFSTLFFLILYSQPRINNRKYPSLLWEITGNGLKKPSHLIGTMHVSSKLAFNLPDSFYLAIRNAQVVALESNPETWQEDMSKFEFSETDYYKPNSSAYSNYNSVPNEYLNIKTLRFYKYDTKIKRALYSNPSTINNLLYRTYGNESSDFEEDTYLDMYIFQCGKKWNKKVTGVEDYGESMKLMAEAYRDAAKDKNIKRRSYNDADQEYSADKLQEAYRTGNLDLLDSINKYNSISEAFDEKFLYKRNEIQARNIDSILRSGTSLFVGVGAAHLPGERGVIEMLRKKGYRLRPVKMGERASREKEAVDKIRVPVIFHTERAADGMYRVDIPGRFYEFGEDESLDQKQSADMSNGSYYMVTRIMTNAWMWNHNANDVYKAVDSLLYENIPGKIVTKTAITKNGHPGFDIINRTRRGDVQRYNIFVTPFEVLLFKMSGNGDYVNKGTEAANFFGSIELKEYKKGPENSPSWKKYSPSYGGFSVDLPHAPFTGNDGSWIFDAADKTAGEHYRVIRTDIHNYHFVEEDSFDLGLMDESFSTSDFIHEQYFRKHVKHLRYPALESRFKDKMGNIYMLRYVIAGPHYYTVVAHGRKESAAMNNFLNSFRIEPLKYGDSRLRKDSTLYFTVDSPVFPEERKTRIDIPVYGYYGNEVGEEETEHEQLEAGAFRNRIISSDSTGEKIFVSFFRSPRYYYSPDSLTYEKEYQESLFGKDSSRVIRYNKRSELPGKMKVWELIISDSTSSRALWGKSFYKDGIGFAIATQVDTISRPSFFLRRFFETFRPADTLSGVDPFVKKSNLFFDDLMHRDSVRHKRAVKHIADIYLDSADFPRLQNAVTSIGWKEKKYLDIKTALINKFSEIPTRASADYLKRLYYELDDTIELQYAVLENLLQQKTKYAYQQFSDIILNEPPVLAFATSDYNYDNLVAEYLSVNADNGKFIDELSDSLQLTKTILPALLPLLNLEDYKPHMLKIIGQLVDSNLINTKDYEEYFSRFLLEARQEMKKQSIVEKRKAIEKAEEVLNGKKPGYYYMEEEKDKGNDNLDLYATVLLPYLGKNQAVQQLIQQMLSSNDKRLKYNTLLLLIRNKKTYTDSLLNYFASLDDYRYQLYHDLKTYGKSDKFLARYNKHKELAIGSLLSRSLYSAPDSVVYLDKLNTVFREKRGYLYFYKYKEKKDDLNWRIAVVGLVPEDPAKFEFEDSSYLNPPSSSTFAYNRYNFTEFSDTKLNEQEPLGIQLKRLQKKLLYSRRKSAKSFYDDNEKGGVHMD